MATRTCFLFCSVIFSAFVYVSTTETQANEVNRQINVQKNTKLKRQNDGGGEEVDLVNNTGQSISSGQPETSGFPSQPGQFFGQGNPFISQQPFFVNGFGYPGGQTGGIPQNFPQGGFLQGFPQGNFQGFNQGGFQQGVPQGVFQQGFPQLGVSGRNVVLQNNGKQYLVQPLAANQRVVEKNGKQYLLQALTGSNAVAGEIPTFNVPDSALEGLRGQNLVFPPGNTAGTATGGLSFGGVNSGGAGPGPNAPFPATPGFSPNNQAYPAYPPIGAATQPQVQTVAGSAKLTSSAPQRVVVNGNGQKFEVEQVPIRNGQSSHYLSTAVGAVAAQLAAQTTGRQYTYHYVPLGGLSDAYNRANQVGYGQYPTNRGIDIGGNGPEPIKRETSKLLVVS